MIDTPLLIKDVTNILIKYPMEFENEEAKWHYTKQLYNLKNANKYFIPFIFFSENFENKFFTIIFYSLIVYTKKEF